MIDPAITAAIGAIISAIISAMGKVVAARIQANPYVSPERKCVVLPPGVNMPRRQKFPVWTIAAFIILGGVVGYIFGIVVNSERTVNPPAQSTSILTLSPIVLPTTTILPTWTPQSPTDTPTSTSTPTLTLTPTLTKTLSPTVTPTETLTPSFIPDPRLSQGSCDQFPPPCTYRVRAGDYYRQIAFVVYGNADLAGIIADANRNADGTYHRIFTGNLLFIPSPENVPSLPYPECKAGAGNTEVYPCWYKVYQGDTYEWIALNFYRNNEYADNIRQANIDYTNASPAVRELMEGDIIILPDIFSK